MNGLLRTVLALLALTAAVAVLQTARLHALQDEYANSRRPRLDQRKETAAEELAKFAAAAERARVAVDLDHVKDAQEILSRGRRHEEAAQFAFERLAGARTGLGRRISELGDAGLAKHVAFLAENMGRELVDDEFDGVVEAVARFRRAEQAATDVLYRQRLEVAAWGAAAAFLRAAAIAFEHDLARALRLDDVVALRRADALPHPKAP
ncbi:MAG TPA: hypothetical protein VEI02_11560 [Planctomycetota bacterium]|nr:hypothetical protein [Planctomycetota bacterium]